MIMEYNENPQVSYWKQKYEDLQAKYDSMLDYSNKNLLNFKEENDSLRMKLKEEKAATRECERLQAKLDMANEKIDELQEDMEFFNSLPWYERMFHKFDV